MPLVQQSDNFAPSSAQDTEADAHPKGRADSNFDVEGAKPIPPRIGESAFTACSPSFAGEQGEETLCVACAGQVVEHHVRRRAALDQVSQPTELVVRVDVPRARGAVKPVAGLLGRPQSSMMSPR